MLDLAIIGGGPAGLTAGLYATRGGLANVIMFELGMPGGQITQSSEIENYPGVTGEITGMELMQPWPEQCSQFGLKTEMDEVKQVSKNEDGTFHIITGSGKSYDAISVLVCTGSVPKRAKFIGEDEFFGRGVSTCATCDGFFYKDKIVSVIGGGDTALEEALFLEKIVKKVYLVHRRDSFRASPSTIERVKKSDKIELLLNSQIKEVVGDNMGVTGIVVTQKVDGKDVEYSLPGVFVFVGRDVMNVSLKQDDDSYLCNLNEAGEVIVDLEMQTNVPGLYAGGDIRINAPKQVVCAAGDGATAAIKAIEFVNEYKEENA